MCKYGNKCVINIYSFSPICYFSTTNASYYRSQGTCKYMNKKILFNRSKRTHSIFLLDKYQGLFMYFYLTKIHIGYPRKEGIQSHIVELGLMKPYMVIVTCPPGFRLTPSNHYELQLDWILINGNWSNHIFCSDQLQHL